jgi:rod shape determining protein RodA
MMVASFFHHRAIPPTALEVFIALVLTAIPAALILVQPDLGTALLIFSSGLFALFLAGVAKRYIVGAVGVAIVSAPLAWLYLLHDYQRQRIVTLFDPSSDALGSGWNIIQSQIAIGSGGLAGKGWRQGTQSQLDFLPESHTDFIIAVLAEEFGLIGVLVLLTVYLLLILRIGFIAANAASVFGKLVAGSMALTLFVYVFVNMGMVAGILPVVGVPLPFVSYGGTAVLTLLFGFGILMAIATDKAKN